MKAHFPSFLTRLRLATRLWLAAVTVLLCLIGPMRNEAAEAGARKSRIVTDFEPVCRALDSLLRERTTVDSGLELSAVMKRGGALDFYFTVTLGDRPFSAADVRWFRSELKSRFPDGYSNWRLGSIYSNRVNLERLVTPVLGSDGNPSPTEFRKRGQTSPGRPIVTDLQRPEYTHGLSGRHIALWQSHGRYYEQSMERWEWQRPCLFQTSEDLLTQSFVLPFLVPMLENAGAYVFLPRERDCQRNEIIVDNDPSFRDGCSGNGVARGTGIYYETGKWKSAGTGFADSLEVYSGLNNPFSMGTARSAGCTAGGKKAGAAARWTPEIPEKGEYAVYVSYKSLPESTENALYTVRHLGGESRFIVNQKMGGGTWIYLGTFTFDKGTEGYVTLESSTPHGRRFAPGSVVTADAVKFGGGMGNIARSICGDPESEAVTSGLPRFVEGARYWMQWAGTDSSVFSQNEQKNDYMDDFMSRGAWVGWLSGGSAVNPGRKDGKKIPIDISFGFHSDAGVTPNDSTIGTLAIYSLRCEGRQKLPDGEDRMTSREYAHLVQSQIVQDVRASFDPIWNRRCLWDRSYSESRTPPVPAMLLELLSHQNFSDMRLGLDPSFRFTVSRAVYKGMLKYLSNRYGVPYKVQPLPVGSFAAVFPSSSPEGNGEIELELSWTDTEDPLEPTAVPEGYILYTRVDSGAFDNGTRIRFSRKEDRTFCRVKMLPGHVYSYKITAYNSGGESFPSEILSAGVPEDLREDAGTVLVVNNFDRVSAPVSYDDSTYAGFDNRMDSGVPYIRDISFAGEMRQFRRGMVWTDDDNPGFGASESDMAGIPVAGNTFDYPSVHGKAIMKAGHPFCSASASAFSSDSTMSRFWSMDLICGKQVTVKIGSGTVPDRYTVFPASLQSALRNFTAKGRNVLVSGADVGTDIWDRVYETDRDSIFREESIRFAEAVLGYRWITGCASFGTQAKRYRSAMPQLPETVSFNGDYDERIYRVEAPDGIAPASDSARTIFRYSDTAISAAISYDPGDYRTVVIGFPIETILQEEAIDGIICSTLKFFER